MMRMTFGSANRFAFLGGCLLLLACAPEFGPTPVHRNAQTESRFGALYTEAAAEYGVPADVLRAVAQTQTAEHVLTESESGQHGLMGLTDAVIAEIAPHVGLSREAVAADPRASVRAAAWLIADRRVQGENWNAAALAVTGFTDPDLRASWVQKFNRVFESGGTSLEATIERAGAGATQATAGSADYPAAAWVPAYSGNYTGASRTHADLYYVVIHDVEGSYEGAISWFQNPSAAVSAHFVTSNEGNITQMVRIADIAWHAGNWTYNEHSVGIEHEGYASDPNSYPETMYVASAALTRWVSDTYIISRDRQHILGHVEIPGSTHHDPGPYWNWDHYMELVDGTAAAQARLVGYVRDGDIYSGGPIAGATVTLDGGLTTTTDASGYYEFPGLALGTYTVTAAAPGYSNAVDSKTVDSGTTFWKSLALAPLSGSPNPTPTPVPGPTQAPGGSTSAASGHHGACDAGFDGPAGASWAGSLFALAALAVLARRRA